MNLLRGSTLEQENHPDYKEQLKGTESKAYIEAGLPQCWLLSLWFSLPLSEAPLTQPPELTPWQCPSLRVSRQQKSKSSSSSDYNSQIVRMVRWSSLSGPPCTATHSDIIYKLSCHHSSPPFLWRSISRAFTCLCICKVPGTEQACSKLSWTKQMSKWVIWFQWG